MKLSNLLFLLLLTNNLFAQNDDKLKIAVDGLVKTVLQKGDIQSLSIGIVCKGETSLYHYGNLGNGHIPSDENHYEIASITKTFTGLLLAQAVADKKLRLDDDIRKYLDGPYPNLEFKGLPVSIRHLAIHRAGLPYTFPNKPEVFVNPDYDKLPFILDSLERGYTKDRFFEDLHAVKLEAAPGSQFRYSNVDANLIAYILEKVYLKPYEVLLKEFIFQKAGMSRSLLREDQQEVATLVKGYNTKGMEMPFLGFTARAAGGLLTTLPDMMKYMVFQLNEADAVIKLSHEAMWKEDKGTYGSGYYWQMDVNKGDRKLFQNGGSYGTSSWMDLYPDSKLGIFIITNVSGPDIHGKLSGLSDKIYKVLKKN